MPTTKVQQAPIAIPAVTIEAELVEPRSGDSPTTILGYDVHPAAALMPEPTPEEFDRLVADIEKNGIQAPITLHKAGVTGDVILDGRSRARAWERLGRPRESLPVKRVNQDDPTAYVLSLNVSRRHLRPDQIAAIYLTANEMKIAAQKAEAATAKAAGLKRGERSRERTDALTGKTAAKIAKATGVSTRTVEKVQKVQSVAPERLAEVAKGKTSANAVLRAAEEDRPRVIESPEAPVQELHREVVYVKDRLREIPTSRLNGKLKILAVRAQEVPEAELKDIVKRLAEVADWAQEHAANLTTSMKPAAPVDRDRVAARDEGQ